jgi:hypothetical protein
MDLSSPESGPWPRRRRLSPTGIAIGILVHIIVLAAMLSWRPRAPLLEPHPTEVTLMLPKLPPPVPPPPAPKPPAPPARSLPHPEPTPEPPPPPKVEAPPLPAAPVDVAPIAPPAALSNGAAGVVGTASAAPAAPAASSTTPPKLFEECADTPERKMVAEVYRMRRDAQSVTEMRGRKPLKTVCLAQLDITPRDFREGFPGLDMLEWFGLDIRFTVNVPEDASYDLMVLSDDGAILSVDEVNVIDNDGIHPPTPVMTTLNMTKGPHSFHLRYFQGPGPGIALMLGWKKTGAADYQYIPRRLLGRPPAKNS